MLTLIHSRGLTFIEGRLYECPTQAINTKAYRVQIKRNLDGEAPLEQASFAPQINPFANDQILVEPSPLDCQVFDPFGDPQPH